MLQDQEISTDPVANFNQVTSKLVRSKTLHQHPTQLRVLLQALLSLLENPWVARRVSQQLNCPEIAWLLYPSASDVGNYHEEWPPCNTIHWVQRLVTLLIAEEDFEPGIETGLLAVLTSPLVGQVYLCFPHVFTTDIVDRVCQRVWESERSEAIRTQYAQFLRLGLETGCLPWDNSVHQANFLKACVDTVRFPFNAASPTSSFASSLFPNDPWIVPRVLAHLLDRLPVVVDYLCRLPDIRKFYKALVSSLNDQNSTGTLLALRCLNSVLINDPLHGRIFNSANIRETLQLILHVMTRTDSVEVLRSAISLWGDLLLRPSLFLVISTYESWRESLGDILAYQWRDQERHEEVYIFLGGLLRYQVCLDICYELINEYNVVDTLVKEIHDQYLGASTITEESPTWGPPLKYSRAVEFLDILARLEGVGDTVQTQLCPPVHHLAEQALQRLVSALSNDLIPLQTSGEGNAVTNNILLLHRLSNTIWVQRYLSNNWYTSVGATIAAWVEHFTGEYLEQLYITGTSAESFAGSTNESDGCRLAFLVWWATWLRKHGTSDRSTWVQLTSIIIRLMTSANTWWILSTLSTRSTNPVALTLLHVLKGTCPTVGLSLDQFVARSYLNETNRTRTAQQQLSEQIHHQKEMERLNTQLRDQLSLETTHEQRIQELEQENRRLAQELEASQADRHTLGRYLKESERKGEQLERSLQDIRVKHNQVEEAAFERQMTIQNLEARLETCQQDLQIYEEDSQVQAERWTKTVRQLQEATEKLTTTRGTITDLQNQLRQAESVRTELAQARAVRSQLETDLHQVREDLLRAKSELTDREDAYQQLSMNFHQHQVSFAKVTTQNQQLQRKHDEVMKKLEHLRLLNTDYEKQLQQHRAELTKHEQIAGMFMDLYKNKTPELSAEPSPTLTTSMVTGDQ
ncbi:hypothetical protein IWQ62_002004 [Dispira parvispora]|uniref:CIP2A N-terminal domain-containing protein n=1 Tax=Dispira parvispora TaxID=1520584 RepID=A0A9W8AX16_9FUNG|nr:hypothetical protein IWQ62_002004 [Dispira parvispora]